MHQFCMHGEHNLRMCMIELLLAGWPWIQCMTIHVPQAVYWPYTRVLSDSWQVYTYRKSCYKTALIVNLGILVLIRLTADDWLQEVHTHACIQLHDPKNKTQEYTCLSMVCMCVCCMHMWVEGERGWFGLFGTATTATTLQNKEDRNFSLSTPPGWRHQRNNCFLSIVECSESLRIEHLLAISPICNS